MVKKLLLLYFLLLIPSLVLGQLANFTLTVTPTNETCLGNGSLSFATTGTSAGSTVTYYVYLLPNQSTPVAVQTGPLLSGQTSGSYLVTAVQVVGSQQNSQSVTVTINNAIVPLSYFVTSTDALCNDGTLTVHVTNGTGSQYELISGPVTRPLQSATLFTGLPAGVYVVRVYDNCGDATVVTHTLLPTGSDVTIGPVSYEPELPSCNSITVSNVLSVGNNQALNYPLEITHVVHFPNGSSQTIVTILATGLVTDQEVAATIPFFYGQPYSYDLIVKDACGNTFTLNNIVVDPILTASLTSNDAVC